MPATYRDGIGCRRCVECLSLEADCTCPPSPKGSEPMAKTATESDTVKPRARAGRKNWSSHRMNTHANNAPPQSQEVAPEKVTVGEAMRRAVDSLGDVTIDDTLAPQQLRQLAELYENVAREQAAYDMKAEAVKIAKKSLESASSLLLEQVKKFTHPNAAALPLFDQQQAETDRAAMVAGGEVTDQPAAANA